MKYETSVFAAILLPVVLVVVDLSSDGGMWLWMVTYTKADQILYRTLKYVVDMTTASGTILGNSTGTTTAWDTTITTTNYVTVTEPTDTTTLDNITDNTTAGGRGNVRGSILQAFCLMLISGWVLLGSTVSLARSNPLPSLLRGALTAVSMGSREEEEKDVSLPLGE